MYTMDGIDESIIQIGTVATELGASAGLWIGNFLALIVLTVVLAFLAMRSGGSGLISLNLSLYSGYALYTAFPYRDAVIGIGSTPLIQAILSIILFGLATIVPYLILVRVTSQSFGGLSIIQNLLLAFLASSFILALSYHVFDLSHIYTFSDPLNQLFEPEGYFFYWFIAPIIGVYFLAR